MIARFGLGLQPKRPAAAQKSWRGLENMLCFSIRLAAQSPARSKRLTRKAQHASKSNELPQVSPGFRLAYSGTQNAHLEEIAMRKIIVTVLLVLASVAIYQFAQWGWNSHVRIPVKGKALCEVDLTPLNTAEEETDGGYTVNNECIVEIFSGKHYDKIQTTPEGIYLFTNVPVGRPARVRVKGGVHYHKHKGVLRQVTYRGSTFETFWPIATKTIAGFVVPPEEAELWHEGPTVYGDSVGDH